MVEAILLAQGADIHVAFTLSAVSRGFRDLVLGTAVLWSGIDILCERRTVALCLERSRDARLDVITSLPPNLRGDATRANPMRIRAFFNGLAPYANQIRSLRMVYTSWSALVAAIRSMPSTLPSLKHLDVGYINQVFNMAEVPPETRPESILCQPVHLCLRGTPAWTPTYASSPRFGHFSIAPRVATWLRQLPRSVSFGITSEACPTWRSYYWRKSGSRTGVTRSENRSSSRLFAPSGFSECTVET